MIVEKARKFVEKESLKPGSCYGYEPYKYHFVPMVRYAADLAQKLGADVELVQLAAWLHDIGSIRYGRDNHHITGAKIAKDFLQSQNYPDEKIKLVEKCILNHRSSTKKDCQSLEEKIISDADAISNFDNLAGIFKAAFIYEELDQAEASKSVKAKLERKWKNLYLEQARDMIEEKYQAMIKLL